MKLIKKWLKASRKLERAKMVEAELRKQVGDEVTTSTNKRVTLELGDEKIVIVRKTGYSCSTADIPAVKEILGDLFESAFYTNYSAKEGGLKKLPAKMRKKLVDIVKEREAPYQITVTEK